MAVMGGTPARIRIGNWNVERPRSTGWKIPPAQKRRMREVDADIWVLTETHLHHMPGDTYGHVVFSPPHPERRPEPERWTAIWSRWPIRPITDPPPDRRGTVAALVDTPHGPLIVYGTVETRRCLSDVLERAGLTCVTAMDVVAEGMLREHHLVDHVCMTPDLVDRAVVSCLETHDADGQRVSDHPTVVVDVSMG